jgi:hypothetical protein
MSKIIDRNKGLCLMRIQGYPTYWSKFRFHRAYDRWHYWDMLNFSATKLWNTRHYISLYWRELLNFLLFPVNWKTLIQCLKIIGLNIFMLSTLHWNMDIKYMCCSYTFPLSTENQIQTFFFSFIITLSPDVSLYGYISAFFL